MPKIFVKITEFEQETNGDITIEREIAENKAVSIVKMVSPKRRDYKAKSKASAPAPIAEPTSGTI